MLVEGPAVASSNLPPGYMGQRLLRLSDEYININAALMEPRTTTHIVALYCNFPKSSLSQTRLIKQAYEHHLSSIIKYM